MIKHGVGWSTMTIGDIGESDSEDRWRSTWAIKVSLPNMVNQEYENEGRVVLTTMSSSWIRKTDNKHLERSA